MTQEWYVYKNDQQLGPYTWEQLFQQARSREILPGDQVWAAGMSGWTAAGQVQGLLAAAPPAPPAVPPTPPTAYAPPPGPAYRTAPAPKKGKGSLVTLLIVLLLVVGGGATAFLLLRDRGSPGDGSGETSIIGSWHGVGDRGTVMYMQFQADGKFHAALPSMGIWTSADYRLDQDGPVASLETYNNQEKAWEKTSTLQFVGSKTIIDDVLTGERFEMERISDDAFEEVKSNLRYLPKT